MTQYRSETSLPTVDLAPPVSVPGTAPPPAVVPHPQSFCVVSLMGDVPQWWRPRLRRLSMGPVEGSMVRWSYHDGSTWASVMFEGTRRHPSAIVGWAVFTLQEAEHPIIGVYVDDAKRGHGYATRLVRDLLDECADYVPGPYIYAVADWWPKYVELIAEYGFEHLEWD